jgi:hypothetical protein
LDVSEIWSTDRAVEAWPAVEQKGKSRAHRQRLEHVADMERTESNRHFTVQSLHTASRDGKRNRRVSPSRRTGRMAEDGD